MSRQAPFDSRRGPLSGLVRAALLAWGLGLLSGCGTEPTTPGEEEDPREPLPASFAWLGTWVGAGEGRFGGDEVRWAEARLRVTVDRAEIRLADCPYCLTLVLEDSLFVVNHVDAMSEVELEVSAEGSMDIRTLSIRRYSGAGGTGNLVDVQLVVRDASGPVGDANFQLRRR